MNKYYSHIYVHYYYLTSRYNCNRQSGQRRRYPLVQINSLLALKNQDGDGEIAELMFSKRPFTNQWLTSWRLRPLFIYIIKYIFNVFKLIE